MVKITREILERGRSINNSWNKKQLVLLGVYNLKSGWINKLIGTSIEEKKVKEFLALTNTHLTLIGSKSVYNNSYEKPIEGWSVDGSTVHGNPGNSEYRCVDIKTGEIIFNTYIGYSTNNIAEFLEILQALIISNSRGIKTKIYSDSQVAITWLNNNRYSSKLPIDNKTKQLYQLLDEGIKWLQECYREELNEVLLWKTLLWGQIPADYGRK